MRKIGIIAAIFAVLVVVSCHFMQDISDPTPEIDWEGKVTAISLDKTNIKIEGGSAEYISLHITPEETRTHVTPRWSISAGSENIFTIDGNASGCVVTGKKQGKGYLKCELNHIVATCLIEIESDDPGIESSEHYIYSQIEGAVEMAQGTSRSISVCLYNGTSDDYENFTWRVVDSDVARISTARNNCEIYAKSCGSTQIIVSHPKAEYDFTFVVFSYMDLSNGIPYISTTSNVVTINTNVSKTQAISFNVKNEPVAGASNNCYKYEDTTKSGAGSIVKISETTNGNILHIEGIRAGQAEITVRNDVCEYPLKIIVVVNTIVENVFITTSESQMLVQDDAPHMIYSYLNGYNGVVDDELFEWKIEAVQSNQFSFSGRIDDYLMMITSGNSCQIEGKKNGVFRLTVEHPNAKGKRSLIVMLTNQKGSAIDSSMFITTDQNYVMTQVKGKEVVVDVCLVGGVPGDESGFVWTLESSDVANPNLLITCDAPNSGRVVVKSRSALTSGTDIHGTLRITPNTTGETGTVKVIVGHEKCMYTTEIIVKVFSEWALLKEPVYVKVKDNNGTEVSLVKAIYSGTPSDSNVKVMPVLLRSELTNANDVWNVNWEASAGINGSSQLISVSPNTGEQTFVSDTGTNEKGTSYISASHPEAQGSKRVLFLTANTESELASLKGVYAEQTYFRLSEDPDAREEHSAKLTLQQFNLSKDDGPNIHFKSENPDIAYVIYNSNIEIGKDKIEATVYGSSAGKTTIEAWYADSTTESAHVIFDIVVVKKGESIGVNEAQYLTTALNAVVIPEIGKSVDVEVTGVGISRSDMQKTEWNFKRIPREDGTIGTVENVVSKAANGGKATLTALAKGKTVITVSNPESMNELDINAKVGDIYEYEDGFFTYITSSQDTYQLIKGESLEIGAALVNDSTGGAAWKWEAVGLDGGPTDVITIRAPTATGVNSTCYIEAVEAGQAYIRITNPLSVAEKELLIVVGNTIEELNGLAYITTNQNVVTVGEQSNVSVSIKVNNAASNIVSGFVWESSDPDKVSVVGSGTTAVLYGNKMGTAIITVTNYSNGITYPLEIIANCVDPIAAAENPYIVCENILTLETGDTRDIIAELIGGVESDKIRFEWYLDASSNTISINSSNDTCRVNALTEGIAQIRIRHPKATGADRTVLVIVNKKSLVNYTITSNDSTIQTITPEGSGTTLTVNLEGGTTEDIHQFKWWASDYSVAELNAVENICTIIPKRPGNTEITVSHPKAKYPKTFQITVSSVQSFGFAYKADVITLTAGKPETITMSVPTINADSQYVTYESMNTDILELGMCTSSLCQLIPKKAGTTTVVATLYGYKNGKQFWYGDETKMVYVNPAPAINSYVKLTKGAGINTITFDPLDQNKTEKILLGATAASDDKDVQDELNALKAEDNLVWTVTPLQGSTASFKMVPASGIGKEVEFTPTAPGTAQITISLPESVKSGVSSKSIYVVVNGNEKATLTIPEEINIIENGGSQIVKATIQGGDADVYQRIKWDLFDDENLTSKHTTGQIATINGTGASVNVIGARLGTVYLVASITSTDKNNPSVEILEQKVCKVNVIQRPEIRFEYPVVTLQPNMEFDMPYSIVPPEDEIQFPVTVSNQALKVDWIPGTNHGAAKQRDPVTGLELTDPETGEPLYATWYDPKTGKGNLRLSTMGVAESRVVTTEVTAKTKRNQITGSFTALVGYNYYFAWDKSTVSSVPDRTWQEVALSDDEGVRNTNPFQFEFSVRPETCEITLQWFVQESDYGSKYLAIDTEHIEGYTIEEVEDKTYGKAVKKYVIKPDGTQTDKKTGIATGIVKFYSNGGQVNTDSTANGRKQELRYYVTNPVDLDTGRSENIIGEDYKTLTLKSYYSQLQLMMLKEVPENTPGIVKTIVEDGKTIYLAQGIEQQNLGGNAGVYSRFDSGSNTLVVGDGEAIKWRWGSDKDKYIGKPEVIELEWNKLGSEKGIENLVNFGKTTDKQGDRIRLFNADAITKRSKTTTMLAHQIDYGWTVNADIASRMPSTYAVINNTYVSSSIAGLKPSESASERALQIAQDRSLVYRAQVGNLKVYYFDYATGDAKPYSIKTYVEVRNSRRDKPELEN